MKRKGVRIYAGSALIVLLAVAITASGGPLFQGAGRWTSIKGTAKCVGTANNGSMRNGTTLVIWDCHDHPDQQWTLNSENLIKNISGKCVGTANNGSMENGTELVIWDCHGHPDQRWTYTENLVKNSESGKCVGTANNGSMRNGTTLVIWDCHGHPDQRWNIKQE